MGLFMINTRTMSREQVMWLNAWCFYMFDAIDGPMEFKPSDKERMDEYISRKRSCRDVLRMHPDFVECCENAGMNAEATRAAFSNGSLTRGFIERLYRSVRPSD